MSSELQKSNQRIMLPQAMSDEDWAGMATSTILPSLQIMGSQKQLVKEGKFPVGNWGLVRGQRTLDLGKEVNVLVLNARNHAGDFNEKIHVFDKNSDIYADIADRSTENNSNCAFGPEFLLYLPDKKTFCTFWCTGKSKQNEAPMLRELMGAMATLQTTLVKDKQNRSWHNFVTFPYDGDFEAPPEGVLNAINEAFCNPPAQVVEEAGDDGDRVR